LVCPGASADLTRSAVALKAGLGLSKTLEHTPQSSSWLQILAGWREAGGRWYILCLRAGLCTQFQTQLCLSLGDWTGLLVWALQWKVWRVQDPLLPDGRVCERDSTGWSDLLFLPIPGFQRLVRRGVNPSTPLMPLTATGFHIHGRMRQHHRQTFS
jgi:hypothetical protein